MSVENNDMHSIEAGWEKVDCFRCETPGDVLYRVGECAARQCSDCSQVFVSPRPGEKLLRDMYDNGYGQEIFQLPNWRFEAVEAVQSVWAEGRLNLVEKVIGETDRPSGEFVVLQSLDEDTGMPTMLEIGVPLGMLFLVKARERGFEIHGHQYSRPIARLVSEGFGAAIHDGSVEDAGFKDAEYDVVCSWDVVEHVPDPHIFVQTIAEIAKPGGVIAISCPNFASVPQKLLKDRWWRLKPGEHIWQFTSDTLGMLFDEVGLPIKRIIQNPLHPANLGRLDSLVVIAVKAD